MAMGQNPNRTSQSPPYLEGRHSEPQDKNHQNSSRWLLAAKSKGGTPTNKKQQHPCLVAKDSAAAENRRVHRGAGHCRGGEGYEECVHEAGPCFVFMGGGGAE